MENTIYLHEWDRFSKVYSLDVEGGRCNRMRRKIDESNISTGFIKKFLFGKKMAFYQIEGDWWIQYKNLKFNVNDHILHFEIKYVGLITVIVAHFDKKKSLFIDTNLGLVLSRKIDPIHDSWDEENLNFITRLREIMEER